jgi:hypothetical protein
MNRIFLAMLFSIFAQFLFAQTGTDSTGGGAAVIIKDTRIAVLEKKHVERRKDSKNTVKTKTKTKTTNTKSLVTRTTSSGIVLVHGFRLMILSTPDRNEAMRVRGLLMKYFPNEKQYMIFQMPNTKITAGNYLDRKQADVIRKKIMAMKIVTNNIYIMSANDVEMRVKKTQETVTEVEEDAPKTKPKKTTKQAPTKKPAKTT